MKRGDWQVWHLWEMWHRVTCYVHPHKSYLESLRWNVGYFPPDVDVKGLSGSQLNYDLKTRYKMSTRNLQESTFQSYITLLWKFHDWSIVKTAWHPLYKSLERAFVCRLLKGCSIQDKTFFFSKKYSNCLVMQTSPNWKVQYTLTCMAKLQNKDQVKF